VCTKKCFFKVFQLCLIYSLIFKVALLLDNSEKAKTYQMNTETSDDRGRVSQAHGRQMEAVGGQVVGGLRQLFRSPTSAARCSRSSPTPEPFPEDVLTKFRDRRKQHYSEKLLNITFRPFYSYLN
jgi:hypothetical protein